MNYQDYLTIHQNSPQINRDFIGMNGPPRAYEKIIQKLEADVREHYRVEEQLRLHLESLEDKLEDFQKERKLRNRELQEKVKAITSSNNEHQSILVERTAQIEETKAGFVQKEELISVLEQQVRSLSKHLSKAVNAKLNRSQVSKGSSMSGSPRTPITKMSSAFTYQQSVSPYMDPSESSILLGTCFVSEDQKKPGKLGEFQLKKEGRNVLDSSHNSAQSRDMSPISSSIQIFHTEIAKIRSDSSSYNKKLSLASGESKREQIDTLESEDNRLSKRTFNRPSDSFYLKLLKHTERARNQKSKSKEKRFSSPLQRLPQTTKHMPGPFGKKIGEFKFAGLRSKMSDSLIIGSPKGKRAKPVNSPKKRADSFIVHKRTASRATEGLSQSLILEAGKEEKWQSEVIRQEMQSSFQKKSSCQLDSSPSKFLTISVDSFKQKTTAKVLESRVTSRFQESSISATKGHKF